VAASVLVVSWSEATASPQVARAAAALSAAGWTSRLARPGLELWSRGEGAPIIAEPGAGLIVIGDCWRRGSLQRVHGDLGVAAPGPMTVRAQRFAEATWGGYLAFFAGGNGWRVLRDPSGALDALTWRRGPLALAATDLASVPAILLPADLALDWDAIADLLRRPAGATFRSPLHGIETVSPGAVRMLGGGEAESVFWRPDRVAQAAEPPDPTEALRASVELAVGAALAGSGTVLIEVSGGFDSAVVATTAARLGGGRRLAAFHLSGDRPEADERAWAESACRRAGLGLFTASLEVPALCARDFEELAGGARPAINALDLCRDRRTVEAAEKTGAIVLVTGKGGDAVFFQPPTAEILSDLVAARGVRGWREPLALGLARRLRRSVWSVGVEALRALRPRSGEEPISPLLGPRARAEPIAAAHPWLESLDALPPARRQQLRGLVINQIARGTTRYGRRLEVRHPLLSQPVMEAALAIPVWRLACDGRERGLARDLFADRLPPEILARQSKGELAAYYAQTVASNLGFLRPYLLDGCLCDARVLDRVRLEAALEPDALIRDGDPVLILSAVAIEAFARHWQVRAPDHPRDARWRS